MKTRPLPTLPSLMLVVGLLAFVGTRPALAQAEGACSLPPGVPAPAPPSVTAQQVEDGSATLAEFTLSARDQLTRLSLELTSVSQAAYLGCIGRQDGSAWHSGSTYLVNLTPDSRVLIHAKDMSLSGRLLNPLIYGAILQALGISPADLASPETALAALVAAAANRSVGPFNVPNIPGASGYVGVYLSTNFGTPLLLIAGFDLDETHLAEEQIDYGDPAVAAEDVVDRETLKAFVEGAWDYFVESYRTGGVAAASRVRTAFRDPNGPWRHGSVYLYILDRTSDIFLLHAGFPNRYDLLPLVPIARDVVTGELILPQVLEAAARIPEGGFLEYFFDDPTDDSDRTDIPKVGYAREFTGSGFQSRYVIGAGFYPNSVNAVSIASTEVEATVLGDAVEGLTVEFSRAIAGQKPNYLWSGETDATGHVSLTVYRAGRVSGYYRAQARNAAGEVVGQWNSIPLNGNKRQVLELTLGGGVHVVRVEPLAAAKAGATTSGLAPNAPNPFNSATQIAYHLSSPGPVQLVIYNVLGQPVRTLVDQFQSAGSYQVQWDARDQQGVGLSSGVYFTRLSYPGGEQTRRLLYLK